MIDGRKMRGGFLLGLVVGLLVGLSLALGVALYVTKTPVPFINKVPQRSAEQDAEEAKRNKGWEPNAPLASKAPRPVTQASAPQEPASAPQAGTRDPAALLSGAEPPSSKSGASTAGAPGGAPKAAAEPFQYFVQAGAYQRSEDAEAQRAKLSMLGIEARVYEREQSGRTVHRVRSGPFERLPDAEAVRARLSGAGIETTMLKVERPAQ